MTPPETNPAAEPHTITPPEPRAIPAPAPPPAPAPEPLTSTEPYHSGHTRATITVVLLLVFAALCLVSIFSSLLQINLLEEAAAGGVISEERAAANDRREGAIGILLVLVNLATVVFFSLWIHRAYRNLRALGNSPHALDYSPGWAVGYFFIPLVNLIMPYRVVREMWEKSDPSVRTREDLLYAVRASAALLPIWWATWIISNFLGRLVARFYGDAQTPETLIWASKADIVSTALWVVAALLAALVVRGIDRRQEARSVHVTYAPEAPPPPPIFTPR